MEYTKGEWRLGSHNDTPFARSELSIYRDDGRKITEVAREGFMPYEEAEANAHLISSAPELYEALKWIADGIDRGKASIGYGRELKLRQALAKAETKDV